MRGEAGESVQVKGQALFWGVRWEGSNTEQRVLIIIEDNIILWIPQLRGEFFLSKCGELREWVRARRFWTDTNLYHAHTPCHTQNNTNLYQKFKDWTNIYLEVGVRLNVRISNVWHTIWCAFSTCAIYRSSLVNWRPFDWQGRGSRRLGRQFPILSSFDI